MDTGSLISVSPGFGLRGHDVGLGAAVGRGDVLVMATEESSGRLRLALKNKTEFYARPRVDVRREIARVDILTEFPSLLVRPQGSEFAVRIPPKGVTVVEVTTAQ